MAFSIYFKPNKMTVSQYNNCIKKLEQKGFGAPKGRIYHACFGTGDKMQIFDIWDTQEAFNQFKTTIEPILKSEGIDIGEPMIAPVTNVIEGDQNQRTSVAA